MASSKNNPWLLVSVELRKDAPFYAFLGFLTSILQYVGYDYFNKANWGGILLLEHIAFHTTVFSILFLWAAGLFLEWRGDGRGAAYLRDTMNTVSKRTVGFASVGSAIIFGFAIVPALFGAFWHAGIFLLCSLYFACLAEVAANPLPGKGGSKSHGVALGVIIGTPLAMMWIGR